MILNSFDELIFVIVMFFFIMLYCIEILYLWEEGMVEGCDVVISDFGNGLLVISDFGDGVELVKLW